MKKPVPAFVCYIWVTMSPSAGSGRLLAWRNIESPTRVAFEGEFTCVALLQIIR